MGAEGHRYSHTAPPRPSSFSHALSCSPFLLFDNFRGRGLPQLHNQKVSRHCVCCFRQSCLGSAAEMGSLPASCSPADLFRQPRMLLPGLGLPQRVEVATVNRAKYITVALRGLAASREQRCNPLGGCWEGRGFSPVPL